MRNPMTGNYKEAEKSQMQTLHKYYIEDIDKEIPITLRMKDESLNKPQHKALKSDFSADTWQSKCGTGLLNNYVKDMIADICAYQQQRFERLIGDGYLDDPTNLFCEEIKHWLTNTLSYAKCQADTKQMVKKRINYLDHIEKSEIFPPGSSHETTLLSVIVGLKNTFKQRVLPQIELEIANSSAREHFEQLVSHSKTILQSNIRFLYFVLRDGKDIPTNCTVDNLRNPPNERFKQVLATESGKYLKNLVDSPSLLKVFPAIPNSLDNNSLSTIETQAITALKHNDFFNHEGKVESYKVSLLLLNESGIEKHFHKQLELLTYFVKHHGLLQELAKFIQLCEQARSLAGTGGDLLVYGFSNEQINYLLNSYDFLIRGLRQTLFALNQATDNYHQSLVRKNTMNLAWVANYKPLSQLNLEIEESLNRSDEAVKQIRSQVNSLSIQERLEKVMEQTKNFFENTDGFAQYIYQLTGNVYPKKTNSITTSPPSFLSSTHLMLENLAPQVQSAVQIGEIKEIDSNPKPPSTIIPIDLNKPPEEIKKKIILYGKEGEVLGDRAIEMLAVMLSTSPGIEEIDLTKNKITGKGAELLFQVLKNYHALQILRLWNNNIGDDGAKALEALLNEHIYLSYLDINDNKIGNEGIKAIARGLMNNQSLTYLNLGYNVMGDEAVTTLVASLLNHPKLQNIRLGNTGISDLAATSILALVKENKRILFVELNDNPISLLLLQDIQEALEQNRRAAKVSSNEYVHDQLQMQSSLTRQKI